MRKASPPMDVRGPVMRSESLPGGGVAVGATSAPGLPTTAPALDKAAGGDGGFQERLLNAESSSHIHGIPGSDRRLAPGIKLDDPADQGVGALMRNTQRLFGVTNRHCIDVEVWRSLTPEERIARHISSDEMAKIEEEYKCDKPLGLSF